MCLILEKDEHKEKLKINKNRSAMVKTSNQL